MSDMTSLPQEPAAAIEAKPKRVRKAKANGEDTSAHVAAKPKAEKKPKVAKPKAEKKPKVAKPKAGKKPKVAKPKVAKPKVAKPKVAKPKVAKKPKAAPGDAKERAKRIAATENGAGGTIVRMLKQGRSDEAIINAVLAKFKDSKATVGTVSWYRSMLKKAGVKL